MPGFACKLTVNAYVEFFGNDAARPKSGKRIAAGQVVQVDAAPSPFRGYRRVVVAANTLTEGGFPLYEAIDGYIEITKLTPASGSLADLLELQGPAVNGPPRSVPSAWQPDTHYRDELLQIARACAVVRAVIELYQERETRVDSLRSRIQQMSGLQIAAGAAGLGLAVAGTVLTFGALAPVFLALGIGISVGSGAASLSSSLASAEIDEIDKDARAGTGTVVAKTTAKGAGAVTAKHGAVEAAGLAGQAARAAASSSLGIAGGAVGIALGVRSLHSATQIDPRSVWRDVRWTPIYQALREDLERIRSEKTMADAALAGDFDRSIRLLIATLQKIKPLVFEESGA